MDLGLYQLAIIEENSSRKSIMFIRLTDDSYKTALDHASQRKSHDVNGFESALIGTLCEQAFKQVTGLGFVNNCHSDGTQHIHFPIQQVTIEVKGRETSTRRKPDLVVPLHKARANLYVLAEFHKSNSYTIHLVGWCLHTTLIKNQITFTKGIRYVVERDHLSPISPLIDRIGQFTK